MTGTIKIKASKSLYEQNTYIFKFSKESLEILDSKRIEVKIINNQITIYKPSLSTNLSYKLNPSIKISTQDARIDLTGEYYIDFEEDDSIGYTLNKTK